MDIPLFKADGQQVTADDMQAVMGRSHMARLFTLANSPRVMRNSCHTNTATVWFDMLNSQSGATAKRLIGSSFQFGPAFVAGAGDTPPVPVILRPPDVPDVLVLILRLAIMIMLPAAGVAPL
ncbi:hypothetical protein AN958_04543 [Leucoagaricus sp. SymC.cos]|nr:hypothetical protein AN958_04543 [Leucoagaricus sp. SymC.cos]